MRPVKLLLKLFSILTFTCVFCFIYCFHFTLFQNGLIHRMPVSRKKDFIKLGYATDNFTVDEILSHSWNFNEYSCKPDCSSNASKMWKHQPSNLFHYKLMKNCSAFNSFWNYPSQPSSKEEADYPLAYVFMAHKNLAQTLRLFRAIYQPQNVYCINWDNESLGGYQTAMRRIGSCFSNVIIPDTRRSIGWCDYSLLQATMDCLRLLRYVKKPWNYVQIVSWNDFPLKTNREMVQIMKIFNGTVDVSLYKPQHHTFYAEFASKVLNTVVPADLVVYKSSYAVTMPVDFVKFMLDNEIARELYSWLNNSICTEELYFSTLAHNGFLHAPGGFPGSCLQFYDYNNDAKQFISRYQVWQQLSESDSQNCKGNFTLESCVFGFGDVPNLRKQYSLVAHKLYDNFEPAALYCLEEWHYEKIFNHTDITEAMIKYYSNMQSVRYHKLSDNEKKTFTC